MATTPLHKDAVLKLIRLALDSGSDVAVLGIVSDVMDSAQAQFEKYQAELRGRVELQREAKHPAPCQKFCEANAFTIELRNANRHIKELQQEIETLKDADPYCIVKLYEFDTKTQMVECPACGAAPAESCSKPDPDHEGFGIELHNQVHHKRFKAAHAR